MKQAGRIIFEGVLATRFWIRTLDLEKDSDTRALILARSERKWGAIPIVAQYKVDERLSFVYLVVAQVDALGIKDGSGAIYYASPERLEEVTKLRDEMAKDVLAGMESGRFDEVVPIEEKEEGKRLD